MSLWTVRNYFRATTAATLTPSFSSTWTNTTDARRRYLAPAPDGSDTLADGDARSWTAAQFRLDRQYIGDQMPAGLSFAGATCLCLALAAESNADDNAFPRFGLRVFNGDCTVVRATLLSVADHGTGAEIATSAAVIRFANLASLASYTTQAGDRLVAELGFTDSSGTTPSATVRYGSSSAIGDLDVGDTATTKNPFLEIRGITGVGFSSPSAAITPYTVTPYNVRPGC